MSRKTKKLVIYLMIAAMALTTLLSGIALWFA